MSDEDLHSDSDEEVINSDEDDDNTANNTKEIAVQLHGMLTLENDKFKFKLNRIEGKEVKELFKSNVKEKIFNLLKKVEEENNEKIEAQGAIEIKEDIDELIDQGLVDEKDEDKLKKISEEVANDIADIVEKNPEMSERQLKRQIEQDLRKKNKENDYDFSDEVLTYVVGTGALVSLGVMLLGIGGMFNGGKKSKKGKKAK